MIETITRNKDNFLKFIKYSSQFYKADYYTFDNVLYLYENCPNGRAFGTYDNWNGIGRRIIKDEHGYRLKSKDNWRYNVFDISQTWGNKVIFPSFDKNKANAVIDNLIGTYKLDDVNKTSNDISAFYNTIYDLTMKKIENENYILEGKEDTFIAEVTTLLVLNRCKYPIDDLISDDILENTNSSNYSFLLDKAYSFYRDLMFEIRGLEKTINIEEKSDVNKNDIKEKEETSTNNSVNLQATLFTDDIDDREKEFIKVLKLGSNFAKSDENIYRIITTINDRKQAIKELKRTFGEYGGKSYTLLDGRSGYTTHMSKGITIKALDDDSDTYSYNWNEIYDKYCEMIVNREFPNKELLEKLELLERKKDIITTNQPDYFKNKKRYYIR